MRSFYLNLTSNSRNSFKRKWGSQRGELIIKSWELKGKVQQDHTRKLFGSNYRDQMKNKKNQ